MKKHRINGWFVLGLLLLAAAFSLIGYNLWEAVRAGEQASEHAACLQSAIPEAQPEQVPDYILNPDMEMPVETIDGVDYIGTLEIPSLSRTLPVISEWSYPLLKLAPCRYEGSAYKDNLIIAAHNYATHFGDLKELHAGDEVTFTDVDGNVFRYEVSDLETLDPYAVEEMSEGEWDLTLFTCTIGGQSRVTVRCVRTEQSEQFDSSP